MKRLIVLLVVVCCSLAMVGAASAALIVDQEQNSQSGSINIAYATPLGQEFIPDVSNLAAVELGIDVTSGTSGPALSVNVRKDNIDGSIVGTGSIDSTLDGWNMIMLDSYAWLTVGDLYVLEYISSGANSAFRGSGYADGRYIFKGTPTSGSSDLQFRTYSDDTAAVPIPGAVWLLGSGLLGLIGIRRRDR